MDSHGSNPAPPQSRVGNTASVAQLREVMKEAVEQQLQRSEEPSDHVETEPHTQCTGIPVAWSAKAHHGILGGRHPTHGEDGKTGTRRELTALCLFSKKSQGFRLL